jgi:hypothetical protein
MVNTMMVNTTMVSGGIGDNKVIVFPFKIGALRPDRDAGRIHNTS